MITATFKYSSKKNYALVLSKDFNSQAHIQNYMNVMERNGYTLDEWWIMEVVIVNSEGGAVLDTQGNIKVFNHDKPLRAALETMKNLGHIDVKPMDLSLFKTLKK